MDYEKKYKEALERARKELQACGTLDCDCARQMFRLFPELKESEDERIKKDLIGFFKDEEFLYHKKEEIVEWLEKQGGIDNCPLECSTNTVMTDSKKNQVKPKFKVGDWINGYYTNYKVLSVNNKGYIVEDVCGNKINILFENEKFHHLWTIQDAKDGDVLVAPPVEGSEHSEQIFIFKEIKDREYVKNAIEYYCRCVDNEFNTNERGFMGQSDDYFTPATKEQRDLLFQKMKEAGYEWDAEKKELKIKLKEPDVYEYELERIVDKLNEVIGKLGDIHEVLSKPYVFPYRDYTPPNSVPGMDVWYKTHGVEKVPPVTCGTTTVCKPETISFNADLQKGSDYDIDKKNIQKS